MTDAYEQLKPTVTIIETTIRMSTTTRRPMTGAISPLK